MSASFSDADRLIGTSARFPVESPLSPSFGRLLMHQSLRETLGGGHVLAGSPDTSHSVNPSHRANGAPTSTSPLDRGGLAYLHHVCMTCREPWSESEVIAGGQDQIARDGLHGDEKPECERLYRRWMTSRSFRPMGGGGH